MDSLTQIALGGAVGAAARGPKLGRAAVLWGAVAGTVPDLDVLAYPLVDPASELLFHRGITHGLAFAFVAGPALGWLAHRLRLWRGSVVAGETWRDMAAVFFWGLFTHPILDVFTIYGTQLAAPFSDRMFAVGSVFILDPAVTLPLALALVVGLWRQRLLRRAALVGLAVACAYIGAGLAMQAHARGTAETALAERGMVPERLLVSAGPLSSLIWRGVALENGQITPFSLHVSDPPEAVLFEPPVPLAVLPAGFAESRNGRTLLWFSHGWLAESGGDSLYTSPASDTPAFHVADVRFGRGGLDATDAWVFRWRVEPDAPFAFSQVQRAPSFEEGEFARLWRWIIGSPEARSPEARSPEARSPEARSPEARSPEVRPRSGFAPTADPARGPRVDPRTPSSSPDLTP